MVRVVAPDLAVDVVHLVVVPGDSTQVTDRSTRAVSSAEIGEALDREVVGGWLDLRSESPEPETPLLPVELPELNNGPHFFYGLQWWFFGLLAVSGFGFLAYDERKRRDHDCPDVQDPGAERDCEPDQPPARAD